MLEAHRRYEFAGFLFDPQRGLERGSRFIPLAPKERRALACLTEACGEVVTEDVLAAAISPRRAASDDVIMRTVYLLRKALAHPLDVEIIETRYAEGYRLAVPVRVLDATTAAGTVRREPTETPAAQMGRSAAELLGRRSRGEAEAAMRALVRATSIDPAYVDGWVAQADLHGVMANRYYVAPRAASQAGIDAAERALALAPESAAALAARAHFACHHEGRREGALRLLGHAVERNPRHGMVRLYRGFARMSVGDNAGAAEDLAFGVSLNPHLQSVPAVCALALFASGRAGEALAMLREVLTLIPHADTVGGALTMIAAHEGLHDEALAVGARMLVTAPDVDAFRSGYAYALARAGRHDEARAIVSGLASLPAPGTVPSLLAPVLLALDDRDGAYRELERARDEGDHWLAVQRFDPRLAALRDESRFRTITDLG